MSRINFSKIHRIFEFVGHKFRMKIPHGSPAIPTSRRSNLQDNLVTASVPHIHKTDEMGILEPLLKLDRDLAGFNASFESIKKELCAIGSQSPTLRELANWIEQILKYNVPHGKKTRALTVLASFRQFAPPPGPIADDQLHLAYVLGWCVELLQAFLLVLDDVMDRSETRRGRQCWYRVHGVTRLSAINDAFLMESMIYQLLDKHFSNTPTYGHLCKLFHRISLFTGYGQALDLMSSPPGGSMDFSKFSEERYQAIVTHKTGYYTFALPVRLGMYLAGTIDSNIHSEMECILLKLGYFFQVQDDYLDCYGDSEISGKIGTDIQDGKCTWLIVKALALANDGQIQLLKAHYGRHEIQSVNIVKSVYNELSLEHLYKQYEKELFDEIIIEINRTRQRLGFSSTLLHEMVNKMYKRSK